MDMIHIREGSRYDGYFEKVAQRISEIMTDEIRETILRLKYETPETEKIIGVEYYRQSSGMGCGIIADLRNGESSILLQE